MLLVNEYTTRIDLDEGEWVEVRPLSWREIDAAALRSYVDTMKAAAELDWNKVVGESKPEDVEALQEQIAADPLANLDILEVLAGGIVAWSSAEPVTRENVALLEPDTARKVAEQIVGLRRKGDLGNSSAPSTPGSTE